MWNDIWLWLVGADSGKFSGGDGIEFDFIHSYSGGEILALAAIFVGLVFLVIRSYIREGDASNGAKGFLAAVRIFVIAVVFAILFQPAMQLRHDNTLYSTVVVLIDDSLSMSFKDKYLTPRRRAEDSDAEYDQRVRQAEKYRKDLASELGVTVDELNKLSRKEIVQNLLVKRSGQSGVHADYLLATFEQRYVERDEKLADESDADYEKHKLAVGRNRERLADELGLSLEELEKLPQEKVVSRLLARRGGPLGELAKNHPMVIMKFSTAEQGQPYTGRLMDSAEVENPKDGALIQAVDVEISPPALKKAMELVASKLRTTSAPSTKPVDDLDAMLEEFNVVPEDDVYGRLGILVRAAGGTGPFMRILSSQEDDAEVATLASELGKLQRNGGLARRIALASLSAGGFETNPATAINNVLDKVSGRRIAAIIVISDGQITSDSSGGRRLSSALNDAKDANIPLYGVVVGDPEPPKNLTVAALQAPPEIRVGSEAEFTATITHRNLDGQNVSVRLQEKPAKSKKWEDTDIQVPLVLAQKGKGDSLSRSLQTITLVYRPKKLGDFAYRAVIEPIPGEEKTKDNKSPATVVTVSENRIRILVISGDAGWEFQYLRNFLVRQRDLYRISVWQQNADPDVNQAASSGMKLTRLPRTMQELVGVRGDKDKPGYNVVLLYDPQYKLNGFDSTFAKLLVKFVKEHNGGLCYIAGNKHTDETLMAKGMRKPLAGELLPVVLAPNTANIAMRIREDRPTAWPAELTSYGVEHPITRLGGSDDMTRKIWRVLPGQYWSHPVYKVKPGARVLVRSSNPMHVMTRGKRLPLLVASTVGSGRSLYIGIEGTWRWRYVLDGHYHRQFWARTIRYLASMRSRRIVVSTGGSRFAAGEKITIEVKAYDKEYNPLKAKKFVVEIIDTDTGKSETVELMPIDQKIKPGQYKRTIVAKRTGSFEVTALRDSTTSPDDVSSKKFVVELPRAEAKRPQANPKTLMNIASDSENFMNIHQAARLGELIDPGKETDIERQNINLWDCPLTLIVIVLLLSIEWIVRKKYNMA